MAIVPFRWQGRARREALRALVAARLQEWLRHWSAKPVQVEVSLASGERPDSGRNGDRWHQLASAGGTLSLRAAAHAHEQLACLMAGVAASDSTGLAAGIGQRTLRDLAATLTQTGSEALTSMDLRPAAQSVEARCGAVGLVLSLETIQIEIYLDAKLCDTLLPPQAAESPAPLVPRTESIGGSRMTLDAVLDLGTASLADVQLLRPGEILKTRIPLDAPISVRSPSGAVVLTGVLTMLDGHRALRRAGN